MYQLNILEVGCAVVISGSSIGCLGKLRVWNGSSTLQKSLKIVKNIFRTEPKLLYDGKSLITEHHMMQSFFSIVREIDELIEQVKDGGVVLATGVNLQYLLVD